MSTVWVVWRYWLSRKTGNPDFARMARVAAFPTRGQALDYAREQGRRFADRPPTDRVRFAVKRYAGSLADFNEERVARFTIREREYAPPARSSPR
jgi:hypothetical protein